MGNPLTRAGNRDRQVTIERATISRDAHNEQVQTWATYAVRFASARPAPGTERFQNAETAAAAPMRFVFLWESNLVKVTDRILHEDGRHYYVADVKEIGRREGLEVLAVARPEEA